MPNMPMNRRLKASLGAIIALPMLSAVAFAQDVADVPRNETLVLTPWGDQPAQFTNLENWNPYLTSVTHQRDVGQFTYNEALFYTNLNNGELIPWQAESYDYADDYMSATIHLREGVEWSDGEAFTAEDVKYTIEAVRDGPPELQGNADFKEWIAGVDVVDPLTAVIRFTKSAPRWVRDNLALGHENHLPMLAEHLWSDKDIATFTNYDLKKGWPLGTGPYKLVSSTSQQEVFDRRDDWWGTKTGFSDAPAPKRIVLVPVSSDEAMGQLHIANQVDGGRQLLIGTFEAAKAQNPKLASWNESGPIWGAADGCNYDLVFNHQRKPWDNVDLHWAINHAIDRAQLSDIGYEGSNYPVSFAFSSYMASTFVPADGPLQAVIDKHGVDNHSLELVNEYMAKAGFERNADGFWALGGEVLDFRVRVPAFIQPIQAPLTQQLKNAGFDATAAPIDDSWLPDMQTGNFDTMVFVHCGSLSEPLETLQSYHSKFSRPEGEVVPNLLAASRYSNPEYDAIIDRMYAVPASPDPESAYMKDAALALDIGLRDLPHIDMLEELHVVTFNNTYWTGWPSAADPYVAPYTPWEAFNLVIHNLQPAK